MRELSAKHYCSFKPSLGNGFLPRLPVSGGWGVKISQLYSDKIPTATYTYVFGVKLSDGVTSGFVGRRRAPEIQGGGRITGSTNNFAGFTDTHVVPKTIREFVTMY